MLLLSMGSYNHRSNVIFVSVVDVLLFSWLFFWAYSLPVFSMFFTNPAIFALLADPLEVLELSKDLFRED